MLCKVKKEAASWGSVIVPMDIQYEAARLCCQARERRKDDHFSRAVESARVTEDWEVLSWVELNGLRLGKKLWQKRALRMKTSTRRDLLSYYYDHLYIEVVRFLYLISRILSEVFSFYASRFSQSFVTILFCESQQFILSSLICSGLESVL